MAHDGPAPVKSSGNIKLIENKGQWNAEVLFKANIPGGDVFITAKGLVYALVDEQQIHELNHSTAKNKLVNAHNYRMVFKGSKSAGVSVHKGAVYSEYYNYYIGNQTQWASHCKAYESVILQNIYPGIAAEIIGLEGYLKLNFLVQPGADPSLIKLKYEGQDKIQLQGNSLLIQTSVANIKEETPVAFQQQNKVECSYHMSGSEVSFRLGSYSKEQALVIDPDIIFGTFSGSVADNFGYTGTYDELGNGFAGGTVFSAGFPVTFGAYQLNFSLGGSRDAGILKFNETGTELLYATYLGGNGDEQPHSIICNKAGDLYILGTTSSSTFPTTTSAHDRSYNGAYDMFVSCLSSDGKTLRYSTFWGGGKNDGINGKTVGLFDSISPLSYNYGDCYRGSILLDKNENVCVASVTESEMADGYPIANAFQPTFGGGNQDGCVFRLTADLSFVLFSSYLGGVGDDAAYSLIIDPLNSIFVCGGTSSPNIGKFQGALSYKGYVDAFVAKIGAIGNSLQKLVYLGTPLYDQAYFIDIDSKNNIFVTGQTEGNFPVKGAVYNNVRAKQFITSLNNNLDSIRLSSVFGAPNAASPGLSPSAFLVDKCDRVYVAGWGGSTNNGYNGATSSTFSMPLTLNGFQKSTDGSDFYLAVFEPDLKQLSYATYYGGAFSHEHVDGGTSRFDKRGVVYQSVCAGCGGYSDFPTTPDAYCRTNNGKRPNNPNLGGCNNALFKFSLNTSDNAPIIRDTFISIRATDELTFTTYIIDSDGDSVTATVSGDVFGISNNPATVLMGKGKNFASATLNWKTLCSHISPDTVFITITASDNACPIPNISTGKIKILVTPPPVLDPPYPQCLQTRNDSTVVIKWTAPSSLKYFKQYDIYRKNGSAPFSLFRTTSLVSDTQYVDTNAYNHLTENYCYFIRTVNTCDSGSVPSRNICSLFQNDTNLALFNHADTILYVTATDTLSYVFNTESINPFDSVFISAGGNIFATNRVLSFQHIAGLQKATYSIAWRSLCDDTKRGTDTILLQLLVRDNQCPQSRTQKATVKIIVLLPPPPPPPVLQCIRSTGPNSAMVRWSKPANPGKYFSRYVLLRKNTNGTWDQLAVVTNLDAFMIEDKDAINNEQNNICYTAYAINTCEVTGDSATLSCTVIKNISPPAPIYIYTTTVKENKNILLQWQKSAEGDFFRYNIFRKDEINNTSYALYATRTDVNDTFLADEHVDVHKSVYCYELQQTNDCGISNPQSFHSCSILLKGNSRPFVHTLQWNDYDYWKKGLNEYAIIRKEPTIDPVVANTTYYKSTDWADKELNIENGLYYYTIEASENNSPFRSVSNTVELIQAPLLHVPNAFTPNHDNVNDNWNPKPVFVKDYHLKLYNRWGQLVFETQDKHHLFTNEFMNDPVTCDVFVYLITYTGWDGSIHTVKDNVTLLK